jgi:hypothetical protein
MKKSTSFLMGMAALLLSFGLILTGCPTDSDNGGGGGGGGSHPAAFVGTWDTGEYVDGTPWGGFFARLVLKDDGTAGYVYLINMQRTDKLNDDIPWKVEGGKLYLGSADEPDGYILIAGAKMSGNTLGLSYPPDGTPISNPVFYGNYTKTQ